MRDSVTIYDVVSFLNQLLKTDREAVSELFHLKVKCNQALADHPAVQVSEYILENGAEVKTPGEYQVGLLGILNGLFGVDKDGWGAIARNVETSDYKTIFEFCRAQRYITIEDTNLTNE